MKTVEFEKRNTLVVAHRGLSGIEKENTASAFVAAGNRSYFGVETDIRRTSDGNLIVSHDLTLERVAGEAVNVEETPLETLQSIILTDKDGTKGRRDLRLPTFENYVSICKKYEKHCVIELKSAFTEDDIAKIIETVEKLDYSENVTFISFKYENLVKVRKLRPDQPVQFLFSEITDELMERLIADRFDVDVYYEALTEENIKAFHDAKIKVNCWTVDSRENAEKLALWGVDYITSNILE